MICYPTLSTYTKLLKHFIFLNVNVARFLLVQSNNKTSFFLIIQLEAFRKTNKKIPITHLLPSNQVTAILEFPLLLLSFSHYLLTISQHKTQWGDLGDITVSVIGSITRRKTPTGPWPQLLIKLISGPWANDHD